MIIEMQNVSWRRQQKDILQDINWQVDEGRHWAIIGLNGSGKTTLLNLLTGYIFPSSGEMTVLGYRFGRSDLRDMRRSVSFVSSALQERLHGCDTALETVLSGSFATIGLYHEPTPAELERARGLLARFNCGAQATQAYETLSQGEKQKVIIARAMMTSPRLLILDEPCTGLDFMAREQLLADIEAVGRSAGGPTIIYVTHHVEEILPVFGHTMLLRDGEVYCAGHTREVLASANLSQFFDTPVEVNWQWERAWMKKSRK